MPYRPDTTLGSLYSQVTAPQPTTSPLGAVLRGILGGMAVSRLEKANQAYLETERQRESAQSLIKPFLSPDYDATPEDRQALAKAYALGRIPDFSLLGRIRPAKEREAKEQFQREMVKEEMRGARERYRDFTDPAKYRLGNPNAPGNMQAIMENVLTSPDVQKAMETNPALVSRLLETPLRNPDTGALEVRPYEKPIELNKGLWDPMTQKWLIPSPPEEDKRNTPAEIRQWHQDARSALDRMFGTLTESGIVIDPERLDQYQKALGYLEANRVKGVDPNIAAQFSARKAGFIRPPGGGSSQPKPKSKFKILKIK